MGQINLQRFKKYPKPCNDDLTLNNNDITKESLQKPPATRRPDIDIIRVGLTWGILLFHTVVIYAPFIPYYVKDGRSANFLGMHADLSVAFSLMMNTWNMPMFFFLSGVSAYFALFKRSVSQFRTERVHRLMVPALFLSLTLFPYGLAYFAPLTYNCQKIYEGVTNFEAILPWSHCELFYPFFTMNTSLVQLTLAHYKTLPHTKTGTQLGSPSQAWFLVYLFTYSQLLASLFTRFHPVQNTKEGGKKQTCCSSTSTLQLLMNPTSSPQEFVSAVKWWLGSPVKLALVPSLAIGGVEAALRTSFVDTRYNMFSVLYDVCNDLKFIFIFFIGYAITAADEELKDIQKKNRWSYFIFGSIILVIYSFNLLFGHESTQGIVDHWSWSLNLVFFTVKGFWRGFAEWLFILGTYSMCREIFQKNYSWLPLLSQMCMPFYLTHQQILVAIASVALWVPYLGSFPSVLLLTTLASLGISYFIVKADNVRYFFGLPAPKGSTFLPGTAASGFLPLICLSSFYIIASVILIYV